MKLQRNILQDDSNSRKVFAQRTIIALFIILLLSGVLIINLFKMQIFLFKTYIRLSNQNRIKMLSVIPIRGSIFDRNGVPLALDKIMYEVDIHKNKNTSIHPILEKLRPVLDLTDEDINRCEKQFKSLKDEDKIIVKKNLSDVQIARFAVNRYQFTEAELLGYEYRYYPYGHTLTHVIGYVSKMSNSEVDINQQKVFSDHHNQEKIGQTGIESYYEQILYGKEGYQAVEVNNKNTIVAKLNKIEPLPGMDIYLSIDVKLQQYIESLLQNCRGVVIVSNPWNGEILALVSTPTYDPNAFVSGISQKDYYSLIHDENHPLYNRAVQAVYPPASTVKPYIAVSALHLGLVKYNTKFFDSGLWQLPNSQKLYHDWKKNGHGYINITKSLEQSVDTFFYQIAYNMGINCLSTWMSMFGYGHRTGIDLPEEHTGNMPTRKWKMDHFKKPWYQGDTISVGIGQGYWTATPIQMNQALMILLNNGMSKVPHLLRATTESDSVLKYVHWPSRYMIPNNIRPIYWKIVKDAMYGVANRPHGTARSSFANAPYKIGAKSGTAQVFGLKEKQKYNANAISEKLRDHKLMTAFAPYKKPRVAVTIILENGGAPGKSVGLIMRRILDYIIIGQKPKSKVHK